jgi:hypothetical protein
MAGFEKDDITMLSDTNGQSSHRHVDSQFQKLAYRTRSASISIPMNSVECCENETILVGHSGRLRSERRTPFRQMSGLYWDAKGWGRRFYSFLQPYIPDVMNPHAKVAQQWNKFFAISCLVAIFVDPLFFFLFSVLKVCFSSFIYFFKR